MPTTPETDAPPDAPGNAFLPILESCEDGVLLDELSDRVRDLIAAMREQQSARGTRPRGSLTLKLDFVMDAVTVEVRADVSVKEPKTERQRSIFWYLRDHSLSANNPRQIVMDLPPREVDIPSTAPRIVA